MNTSGATSTETADAIILVPRVDDLRGVSDDRLLELQRRSGAARRQVDAIVAAISGEIARRSDRALGHDGLAARTGARSPEKAVQQLIGVSLGEARALVAAGSAMAPGTPWLEPVSDALDAGEISVAAAAAITRGLGAPSADVASDDLLDAAAVLVAASADSTPESIASAARNAREQLDSARIDDLEEHRRSRRSLTWSVQPDGMTRMTALLDPESAAIVTTAIDTILSPRRGGPRFVDAAEAARAEALVGDPRSNQQLAVDTLVDIVQLAIRASGSSDDPARLFGVRSPGVRVHVQSADLARGEGFAYIEGQTAFISLSTAKRLGCESGWLPVLFDGDAAIDVGRIQRLHSPRQRRALAAEWNGCGWGTCDRPPWMTEVHHIDPWNGTNTTLENGIPLCRFHHMQLHAKKWRIEERGAGGLCAVSPDGHIVPLRRRNPFASGGSRS